MIDGTERPPADGVSSDHRERVVLGRVDLSNAASLRARSSVGCLRGKGEPESPARLFADEVIGEGRAGWSLKVPAPPRVPCGCQVCLIAASQAPNAARGQLSACESKRRQRERSVFGTRLQDPGDGYLIREIAQFLRCDLETLRKTAKRLRLLRRLPGDRRFAPLSRLAAKRLIQEYRAR